MHEYIGEAVVLARDPQGEQDSRVSLFTKRWGKMVAKAVSARKLTSKLSPHLEPGNLALVRLIEKNGLIVADALKKSKTGIGLRELHFLNRMLAETEPDAELWHAMTGGRFSWTNILRILGWDPAEAQCDACGKAPELFHLARQEFFCRTCTAVLPKRAEIIRI